MGRRRKSPPRKSRRWLIRAAVIVGLLVVVARWLMTAVPERHNLPEGTYHVERVVAGDTLEVAGQTRIRLLGIAAPYRGATPAQATAADADLTRRLIADRDVWLQFDRNCLAPGGELLAFVWLNDEAGNRRLLNEELIRAGEMRFDPRCACSSSLKRRLKQAADEAQRAGRGLWASK